MTTSYSRFNHDADQFERMVDDSARASFCRDTLQNHLNAVFNSRALPGMTEFEMDDVIERIAAIGELAQRLNLKLPRPLPA